jgi:NADPH-dependent 2,4-dienoyl-CoA reductase/sulfur reductase-like enzyme
VRRVDVAVVGGGPAGLSAAGAAARAGARVALFDENRTLGGQLRYRLDPSPDLAKTLIAEAAAANVELRPAAVVWGLFAGGVLAIAEPDNGYQVRADQIVLATGSTDRPFPFSGGTLPGVITARGVQILLHVHRVLPGRMAAVIGPGSEADEVARDLETAGGQVVVRIDAERDGRGLAAEGDRGVEHITVAGKRYDVDLIVVAVGRQPDAALALMAECDAGYAAALGGFVPLRDADLRCSVPGIIVAGDAGGVCDAETAIAEGRFAGASAAAALGLLAEDRLAAAREIYLKTASERVATVASLVAAPVRA